MLARKCMLSNRTIGLVLQFGFTITTYLSQVIDQSSILKFTKRVPSQLGSLDFWVYNIVYRINSANEYLAMMS
jgi:hypothetical protein